MYERVPFLGFRGLTALITRQVNLRIVIPTQDVTLIPAIFFLPERPPPDDNKSCASGTTGHTAELYLHPAMSRGLLQLNITRTQSCTFYLLMHTYDAAIRREMIQNLKHEITEGCYK